MNSEGIVLEKKMQDLVKGFFSGKLDAEYRIRLLRGILTTGMDLLAELRAKEIIDRVNVAE